MEGIMKRPFAGVLQRLEDKSDTSFSIKQDDQSIGLTQQKIMSFFFDTFNSVPTCPMNIQQHLYLQCFKMQIKPDLNRAVFSEDPSVAGHIYVCVRPPARCCCLLMC